MPVELSECGAAITSADVVAFELRIGFELPADYRAFLLKYNGGRPGPNMIRNAEIGDCCVKQYFGIREEEHFSLETKWQRMRQRVLADQLAIAIDDFGNLFCISVGTDDYGALYFWDHEWEAEEGEEPSYQNLTRLAVSFSDFWVRMEPFDPRECLGD